MPKKNSNAVVLTDARVRSLKVGADGKRIEVWDADMRGLCIRVSPTRKCWVFRYRRPDGSQPRVTLGDYAPPEEKEKAAKPRPGEDAADQAVRVSKALTVAGARARARKLRTEIDDGGDPAGAKALAKAEAKAQPIRTVDDLAREYFAACERGEYRPSKKRTTKRPQTLKNERWMYDKHLSPDLGAVRVESLTREAVKKALRKMLDAGNGVMANRVRSLLQRIYSWANVEGRTDINPAASIDPMAEEKPRTRVMTDDEVKRAWSAFRSTEGLRSPDDEPVYVGRPVRIALQLAMLTLQRRTEVAGMRLDELDLTRDVWSVAPERTKNGKGQNVPLTPYAKGLIEEAIALARLEMKPDDNGVTPDPVFVFPGRNDPLASSIDPAALSHAFRDLRAALKIEDVTVHDFRRLGASLLCGERIGVSPYTAGLILNHTSERGGAAAVTLSTYVHADTLPEKRRALLSLERLLLEIVGEREPSAKVVPMREAAAS